MLHLRQRDDADGVVIVSAVAPTKDCPAAFGDPKDAVMRDLRGSDDSADCRGHDVLRIEDENSHGFTRPNYLRKRQDQMKSTRETEEPCQPYESIQLCLRRSQPVSQCRS